MSLLFLLFAFVGMIMLSTAVFLPGVYSVKGQLSGVDNIQPSRVGVKITYPKQNQTVPTGPLTVYGISSNPTETNCQVYVDWNDTKPMQNVTAIGKNGPNDYSNWTFTYTQKYHLITEGINELTSKIGCHNKSGIGNVTTKYYSINVRGKGALNTAAVSVPTSLANASTINYTAGFQNVEYHHIVPQFAGASNNLSNVDTNTPNTNETGTYAATINDRPFYYDGNFDSSTSSFSSQNNVSPEQNHNTNSVSPSGDDEQDKKSSKAKDASDDTQSNDHKKGNEKTKTHSFKHNKSFTVKKFNDISHNFKFKQNNGGRESEDLNGYIHNLVKEKLKKIPRHLFD